MRERIRTLLNQLREVRALHQAYPDDPLWAAQEACLKRRIVLEDAGIGLESSPETREYERKHNLKKGR